MEGVHDKASVFIEKWKEIVNDYSIVKWLFKPSWVICQAMHIRKPENEGMPLRR